jgi:hypothetical protein
MRRLLALAVLLLQSCDKPAPPTSMPKPSGPPPGVLRLSRTDKAAGEILKDKPTAGFPTLTFHVEYAGPRPRLELHREGWHKGKRLGEGKGNYSLQLPLSGDGAFALSDGKGTQGEPAVVVHASIRLGTTGTNSENLLGDTTAYPLPSLQGRSFRTLEPGFPRDVPDGTDAVWAVFVDEPADVPAGATPEERAKRADTAWIFRIRTADEKK